MISILNLLLSSTLTLRLVQLHSGLPRLHRLVYQNYSLGLGADASHLVTKTDDLSPEEIIRSMGLLEDPWLQELEKDIRCVVQNIKVRKQQLNGK